MDDFDNPGDMDVGNDASDYAESDTSDTGDQVSDTATGGDTSDAEADGKPVPYGRFRESREQLRQVRDQLAQTQQQFAQLVGWAQTVAPVLQQLQQGARQAPPPEDEPTDPLEREVKELRQQLADVSQWRQQQARQAEATRLQGEIEAALSQFEHASPHEILNALKANPRADVRTIAKRSHDGALRRYEEWSKKRGQQPAPRRTLPGGSTTAAPSRQRIRGFDEAREAVLAQLGQFED